MSKATEMARVSAKGGFHLLWGLVLSTVISAVGTIVIARLLGQTTWVYTRLLSLPQTLSLHLEIGA